VQSAGIVRITKQDSLRMNRAKGELMFMSVSDTDNVWR
jgi:hypothetical protein